MTPRWYRVYPDTSEEKSPDRLWIVDEGTYDSMRSCFKIIISVLTPVNTDEEFEIDHAWFCVHGVLRETADNRGRKIITITRR
jgi:hypothetical protein